MQTKVVNYNAYKIINFNSAYKNCHFQYFIEEMGIGKVHTKGVLNKCECKSYKFQQCIPMRHTEKVKCNNAYTHSQ